MSSVALHTGDGVYDHVVLCSHHVGAMFDGMTASSLCTLPEGHEGEHLYAHPRRDIGSGRVLSMYGLDAFRAWLEEHPETFP